MQRDVLGRPECQAPHRRSHMCAVSIAVMALAAGLQGGEHLVRPAAGAAVPIAELLVRRPDPLTAQACSSTPSVPGTSSPTNMRLDQSHPSA